MGGDPSGDIVADINQHAFDQKQTHNGQRNGQNVFLGLHLKALIQQVLHHGRQHGLGHRGQGHSHERNRIRPFVSLGIAKQAFIEGGGGHSESNTWGMVLL